MLMQAKVKKQCSVNGRQWLLWALLGHPSSPRYVTRCVVCEAGWGLLQVHAGTNCLSGTPYPPLVVFAALLGIWGGKLTSNPIVVRAYLYSESC